MSNGRIAAAVYSGLSLVAALIFLVITILTGDYSWVARIGGALWIFALCMIILMPVVPTLLRNRS